MLYERRLIISNHKIEMDFKTSPFQVNGLKEHFHNGYEILFITEGKSNFTINNRSYTFQKNSIVFINNLEKHKMNLTSKRYSRYMIIIDSDFFDSVIKDPTLLSIFKIRSQSFINGIQLKNEHVAMFEEHFRDLNVIYQKKDQFWQIEFNASLSKFMVLLYRNYTTHFPITNIGKAEERVLKIQTYIDENFRKDISLESISSLFFINKFYLAHSFRDVIGFTIKQYIILKKIAYAKNELYFKDNSITEIAMESGFNSHSNFIRIFQKKEGMTPLQFRKYYRDKDE